MTTPFPRRGIPFTKPILPVRPKPPEPLFRTASGRRLILYALGLVAVAGTMMRGVGASLHMQGGDSRPVALTDAPQQDVPPALMHQLSTLEDFTRAPNNGAIAATLKFLGSLAGPESGPESRPAPPLWTDLDLPQALAHPQAFRGGLVTVRGGLLGIETRTFPITGPDDVIYRGYVIAHQGVNDYMVTWETQTRPPDVPKSTMLEIEGVFLQAIEYQDAKGNLRRSPFIVAGAVREAPAVSLQKGFLDRFFVPAVVILIILILVTTLFLLRKARTPAPPRYTVRPPGPGR